MPLSLIHALLPTNVQFVICGQIEKLHIPPPYSETLPPKIQFLAKAPFAETHIPPPYRPPVFDWNIQ